jgi:VIT1/CCC1 family predicted Fe2+/Mn2+ transporter
MSFRKKKIDPVPSVSEDDIQQEIRKRILKESGAKAGLEDSREATKATLDALEDMVSLSREEMERIAEEVRAEFQENKSKNTFSQKARGIVPWTGIILIILTFLLMRRGSSWYVFTGILLVFVVFNYFFRKPPSDDDNS